MMKRVMMIALAISMLSGCAYTSESKVRYETDPETHAKVRVEKKTHGFETADTVVAKATAKAMEEGKNAQIEDCDNFGNCKRAATGDASVVQAASGGNGMGMMGMPGMGNMFGGGIDQIYLMDSQMALRDQMMRMNGVQAPTAVPVSALGGTSMPVQQGFANTPTGQSGTASLSAAGAEALKKLEERVVAAETENKVMKDEMTVIKKDNEILLGGEFDQK
ncbi:hypothetical protein KKG19_02115 [Patescibacteria group bacterium]|nr:hypothetical protein [Patescibacteria group bacterium]